MRRYAPLHTGLLIGLIDNPYKLRYVMERKAHIQIQFWPGSGALAQAACIGLMIACVQGDALWNHDKVVVL